MFNQWKVAPRLVERMLDKRTGVKLQMNERMGSAAAKKKKMGGQRKDDKSMLG